MKRQLLLIASASILSIPSFSQQWLYFPSGINNNRVDIGNVDVTGDSITIEALITLQNSTPPTYYDIVSKHYNISDANYLLRPFSFEITTSSGFAALVNPIQLCEDTTYHVACTYDGDSMKYFVNSVQVASQHWTGNLFQNSHTTGIGNMFLVSAYYEQFIGYIDEVRIWNIVRSQTQLSSNMYNLPNPTLQVGLLAYYKFDGNYNNIQGNSAYDGIPIGAQLLNTNNSLFNGSVSNNFCTPAAISEIINSFGFDIFPNPNKGFFKIDFHKLISNGNIEILNTLGESIFKENIFNETKKEMKLKNISGGIYFVKVFDGVKYYCKKIIIELN